MKAGAHPFKLKRDKHDPRDHVHEIPPLVHRTAAPTAKRRPRFVDLRRKRWPVFQQAPLNACTANAMAGAIQLLQWKERLHQAFVPSRLFIYYNERKLEPGVSVRHNEPVYLRTAFKAVRRFGVCPESMWPYIPKKFAQHPPKKCYAEGKHHRTIRYAAVQQNLTDMRGCLIEGYPFTLGFDVYLTKRSFDKLKRGEFDMPWKDGKITRPSKRLVLVGGHAVLVVGFSDYRKAFLIRNSWGDDWGDKRYKGYGWMPYAMATNPDLAYSLWTLRYIN